MIPEDYKEVVDKITEEVIKYENKDNLTWTSAYKDILRKLNMEKEINDDKLLIYVVRRITQRGFDIIPFPFKLKSFR